MELGGLVLRAALSNAYASGGGLQRACTKRSAAARDRAQHNPRLKDAFVALVPRVCEL